MKVICVNTSIINGYNLLNIDLNKLKEGETYTVIKFVMTPNRFVKYYLLEVPDESGFSALRFIPLSEIDETEMVRESLTEKV